MPLLLLDIESILKRRQNLEFGSPLAAYVRSACIYEFLYKEDIEGKNEIIEIMSDYINVVNRIQ